jgi:hypothetical protein
MSVRPARYVKGKPVNPKGERLVDGRPVTTTSTFSPRLLQLRAGIDAQLRQRFAGAVRAVTAFNMHGWQIARATRIESWKGTIDPNFIHIGVAERAAGITLHLWNPYNPACLKDNFKPLTAAGFKVMVGCLQFNRKAEFPLQAVTPLLDDLATQWRKEGGDPSRP